MGICDNSRGSSIEERVVEDFRSLGVQSFVDCGAWDY